MGHGIDSHRMVRNCSKSGPEKSFHLQNPWKLKTVKEMMDKVLSYEDYIYFKYINIHIYTIYIYIHVMYLSYVYVYINWLTDCVNERYCQEINISYSRHESLR